jgi:hypothetical protein
MSTQPLLDFYTKTAASVFLVFNPETSIATFNVPDEKGTVKPAPVAVGSFSVVLPTPDALKEGFGKLNKRMAFHPLSENIINGESDIIKLLKRLIIFRLNYTVTTIADSLIRIAADPEKQASLNTKQLSYLQQMPEVKASEVKKIDDVINAVQAGSFSTVNIYLQKIHKLNGVEYRRVAAVNTPLKEEFDREDKVVFGVELGSVRAKDNARALFTYILGDLSHGHYSTGSDASVAPYLVSLLGSFYKLAKHLNKITKLFKDVIPCSEHVHIDTSWYEHIAKLDDYRDMLPPLAGNEGAAEKKAKEDDVPAPSRPAMKAPTVKKSQLDEPDETDAPWVDPVSSSKPADKAAETVVAESGGYQWKPPAPPPVANGYYQPTQQSQQMGYRPPSLQAPQQSGIGPNPNRDPFAASYIQQPVAGPQTPLFAPVQSTYRRAF